MCKKREGGGKKRKKEKRSSFCFSELKKGMDGELGKEEGRRQRKEWR